MSIVFYNDSELFVAKWLENLIEAGHLPRGIVDVRPIQDIQPDELRRFSQCHFFAGIGGWAYALRLAGWPATAPVWTGSCPCQPLSSIGKRQGHLDERHLWPEWFRLICQCRPPVVFGEQVASSDGLEWLEGVFSDLEDAGYACGAADLCAASVGAPHIRQRLWWVACSDSRWGIDSRLGDASGERLQGKRSQQGEANANKREQFVGLSGNPWDRREYVACIDGAKRPVESGLLPLAYGIPSRMGRLRAYGNAIVPQVAAVFIRTYMES